MEIYWNYKAALNSNDFNRALLGVLQPGRYRGYDNIFTPGGMDFELTHTLTGIKQTLENLSQTNEKGIIVTKQGFVIQDQQQPALTCDTNGANNFQRIDVVVCTHQDVNVIGGQDATYEVIRGDDGGPVEPPLPNPTYQVKIGIINIPASATDLSTSTYTPARCPLLGGQDIFTNFPQLDAKYAKLTSPNVFSTRNSYNFGNPIITSNFKWIPANNGNIFSNVTELTIKEIEAVEAGTMLEIVGGGDPIHIVLGFTPTQGGSTIISTGLSDLGITTFDLTFGDSITLRFEGFFWNITNFSDSLAKNIEARLSPIETLEAKRYVGDIGQPAYSSGNWSGVNPTSLFFYKNSVGQVFIQGLANWTGSGSSNIFTLPVGYRPPNTIRFTMVSHDANTPNVTSIDNLGNVFLSSLAPPSPTTYSLGGINFTI